jgi:hypothetical protein
MEEIIVEHESSRFTFSKLLKSGESNKERLVQVSVYLYPNTESFHLQNESGIDRFDFPCTNDIEKSLAQAELIREAILFVKTEFERSRKVFKKKETNKKEKK